MKKLSVGKKIRALRKEAGLTQVKLAEKIGVTALTIVKIENDHWEPSLDTLRKLAKVFNVTLDEIGG